MRYRIESFDIPIYRTRTRFSPSLPSSSTVFYCADAERKKLPCAYHKIPIYRIDYLVRRFLGYIGIVSKSIVIGIASKSILVRYPISDIPTPIVATKRSRDKRDKKKKKNENEKSNTRQLLLCSVRYRIERFTPPLMNTTISTAVHIPNMLDIVTRGVWRERSNQSA